MDKVHLNVKLFHSLFPNCNHNNIVLPHTADVQIHAWGSSLREAFIGAAHGLYECMTPEHHLHIHPTTKLVLPLMENDTLEELLQYFLDELLFRFQTKPYLVAHRIQVERLEQVKHDNEITRWILEGWIEGEPFDRHKHAAGTEVKAITSSNLRISTVPPFDIYFIVDI